MSVASPRAQAQAAGALALLVGFVTLLDPRFLGRAGPEAWGGVAFLALVGASSARWRVRPSIERGRVSAGAATLVALGVALGSLARGTSPLALVGLGLLGVLASEARASAWSAIPFAASFLLAAALGFVAEPWSAGGRLLQATAGFGAGASAALVTLRGADLRPSTAAGALGAGALLAGWALL